MIRLEKDGRRMGARNEIQASAFIKNGWSVVDDTPVTDHKETEVKEPVKRGRKPKAE